MCIYLIQIYWIIVYWTVTETRSSIRWESSLTCVLNFAWGSPKWQTLISVSIVRGWFLSSHIKIFELDIFHSFVHGFVGHSFISIIYVLTSVKVAGGKDAETLWKSSEKLRFGKIANISLDLSDYINYCQFISERNYDALSSSLSRFHLHLSDIIP